MYKALLFAPDGDWQTDCEAETIEGVIDKLADLGSRWYFYPLSHFIIKAREGYTSSAQRIIAACEPFEHLKGRSIATVSKFINDNPELITAILSQ